MYRCRTQQINRGLDEVILWAVPVVAVTGLAAGVAVAAPSFQGLGDLSGGTFQSSASDVSPDGTIVIGGSQAGAGGRLFRWTPGGGMVELAGFPGGGITGGGASSMSSNGTTLAGSGPSTFGLQAFRWSESGGTLALGDLPGGAFNSQAHGISADGTVVIGKGTTGAQVTDIEAFRWTAATGMVGLGDLTGGSFRSEATDISDDGSIIVGWGTVISSPEPSGVDRFRAFRWTEADGMVDLGTPLSVLSISGFTSTRATAISSDGSVIVGSITNDTGNWEPFVWTESAGMAGIGDLPGGSELLWPNAVANNAAIVGQGLTDRSGDTQMEAFLWDPINGMQLLHNVLTDLGLDLTGWTLETATGISDDGLTIVGTGINPDGNTEAFIARLPEPGAFALVAVGMAVLVRRQRA